ncbi:hypothetical protein R3P38DRAFT_2439041, partial [Favolaschia claudopus]
LANMPDPVYDANNPNPIIDRAASTRQSSNKDSSAGRNLAGFKFDATGPRSQKPSAPSAQRDVATLPSSGAPMQRSSAPAKSSRSRTLSPTPTAVVRQTPPHQSPPALGALEPRIPSHMKETGIRGHAPIEIKPVDAVTRPASADGNGSVASEGGRSERSLPSTRHSLRGPSPQDGYVRPPSGSPLTKSSGEESDILPHPEHQKAEGESITVALSRRREEKRSNGPDYPKLFTGPGAAIDVFDEPILASVERLHGAYDPADGTEDPLSIFGAVGGELPGYDSARTLALRDAVTRYIQPSRFFDGNLVSIIQKVVQLDAGKVVLRALEETRTSKRIYSLNLNDLSDTAHASQGVQQILEALTEFLQKDPKKSFILDPGYGFLKLAEYSEDKAEVRFALSTLQRRLDAANTHIIQYLQRIQENLTGDAASDAIGSMDSTISSVREAFGKEHPSKELRRMLLRPGYYLDAGLIDAPARDAMILQLREVPRTRWYKPRTTQAIPTLKE